MKSIGLLGGSFDPPHRGHLYISLEAKKILQLDGIWWLVTPKNPLKISKPATYKERIYNCKTITRKHPIKIKEIEKKIWDLLSKAVKDRSSEFRTPVFICGNDMDLDGRVVVLRKADQQNNFIQYHSDIRSSKIEKIGRRELRPWALHACLHSVSYTHLTLPTKRIV